MSRTVTLAQLRADIAAQADFTIGSAGRYTSAILNRFINQSIQRFRERLSTEGSTHFLVAASGTLTPGATSPYQFNVLDLSAVSPSLVRTFGVDVTLQSTSVIRSLSHTPFTMRSDYGGPQMRGEPLAWAHFQTRKIAIMPSPQQAYPYTVWYLPVLDDLVQDSDTFDGVAGWEDYIVWDVVCRMITRDQYQDSYPLASGERDRIWADILRSATKVSAAGGAHIGRDTMGQRGLLRVAGRKGPLPPP